MIAYRTSFDLETETKYKGILRLETETETMVMPETRPRRESRLASVREIGREKQNFCAVRYTMREHFLSWSQLSFQEKAFEVKFTFVLEYELWIKIWNSY